MQGGEHCSGREHGDGGAGQIEEFILVERKGNWWEGGRLWWHVRRRFWIMSSVLV
jgi:hypothetical protein